MAQRPKFEIMPDDHDLIQTLSTICPRQHKVLMAVYTADPPPPLKLVAMQFGIPHNTVKTRLMRARQKIIAWRVRKSEVLKTMASIGG